MRLLLFFRRLLEESLRHWKRNYDSRLKFYSQKDGGKIIIFNIKTFYSLIKITIL
jgi:hypothetical protein